MNIAEFVIELITKGDAQASGKIRGLQKDIDAANRTAERLSKQLSGGLGSAIKSIPGGEFLTNPIAALSTGIGIVTKLGMEAEKTTASFNVLAGSEVKAAKVLGELNDYADDTIWDRSTIQSVAQTMLNTGASVEAVVGDLKMLGDVAMGDKNKLQQLGLAFSQVSSATKLQGNDYHQLINAGFNPLLEISEMTGESFASLQEKMSKGLITFDMVKAAFQHATGEGGRFHDSVNKIAKTAYGAFEQLKGKLLKTLLELYDVIQPYIIPVFDALGKALNYVSKMAKWAAGHMETLLPIIKVLAVATIAYRLTLKGLIGTIKIITTLLSLNPFGLAVAGIAALTAIVIQCWNKFAGFRAVILTVWDTVKGFGEILKQYVLDRITGIIAGIGQLGRAIDKLFHGDFSGAWEAAKTGAMAFTGITAGRNAASSARSLAAGVRGNYAAHLEIERQKQAAKDTISGPKAAGGTGASALGMPAAGGAGSGASAKTTANEITTGGTRNTSIVINIGKFFEDVNITNTSGRDFPELRDAVLESVNRSLEIALSAAK